MNYGRLEKLASQILNGSANYMKFKVFDSDSFMPLSIGIIEDNVISMTHFYKQNGDLMCDPDMELKIDAKNKTVEALTYQQDGLPFGTGTLYQEVYPEPGKYYPQLKKDLNNFLKQWLINIKDQNYKMCELHMPDGEVKLFNERGEDITVNYILESTEQPEHKNDGPKM